MQLVFVNKPMCSWVILTTSVVHPLYAVRGGNYASTATFLIGLCCEFVLQSLTTSILFANTTNKVRAFDGMMESDVDLWETGLYNGVILTASVVY